MEDISFILNGSMVTAFNCSGKLLIDVLREDFQLTGTKRGCESGECGCCTVLLDGAPIKSCTTRMQNIIDREVTTIEGLSKGGMVHVLQKAFAETGAVQCGFCTPAMIMRAISLLEINPAPSREQIVDWMQPVLCRCGSYQKIIEAIQSASTMLKRPWVESFTVQPARIDAMPKVSGRTRYTADLIATSGEAMLVAKVVRSPYHHARIDHIDIAAALGVAGVVAVFTAKDIPGKNTLGAIIPDQPILAENKVRWRGEPVALVVADSEFTAREGVRKVMVEYAELPFITGMEEAMTDQVLVHEGSNIVRQQGLIRGDTAAAMQNCDVIVEYEYRVPRQEHAYLECEAGFAYLEENRVVVISGNQAPYGIRALLAQMLGCSLEQVRIIQQNCGGSFGGKLELSVEPFIALAAFKLGRAVSMIYTRAESFAATHKSHAFLVKHKMGADRSGKILASEAVLIADTGAYALSGPALIKKATVMAYGAYDIPNVKVSAFCVYTNNIPSGALRGFGSPQVTFAVESQVDEIARRLNQDPIDLRLKNIFRNGSRAATGELLDSNVKGLEETLVRARKIYAQERIIIDRKNRECSDKRFGLGVAALWFGVGRTATKDFVQVDVDVNPDGTIKIYMGLADVGQGSSSLVAQAAARELSIPVETIAVVSADTELAPEASDTNAGKASYIALHALLKALSPLKAMFIKTASEYLGCPEEELLSTEGGVYLTGSASTKSVTFAQLASLLYQKGETLRFSGYFETRVTNLDPITGQGLSQHSYTYSTHLAEVEILLATGEINVLKTWCIHDVGQVLNRKNLEAQVEGGVIMGLGRVLKEEFVSGSTRSLAQYAIPGFINTPEIYTDFVEEPDPFGPYGARGACEGITPIVLACMANAVRDAAGVRFTELPITGEKVMQAISSD